MSDAEERVEELESKVERLEATVKGLTEELVEVNERLETLEDDGDAAASPKRPRTHDDNTDPESDEAKGDETQEEDETGDDSGLGDDIIVA